MYQRTGAPRMRLPAVRTAGTPQYRSTGNAGLGLAISSNAAARHSGSVVAEDARIWGRCGAAAPAGTYWGTVPVAASSGSCLRFVIVWVTSPPGGDGRPAALYQQVAMP